MGVEKAWGGVGLLEVGLRVVFCGGVGLAKTVYVTSEKGEEVEEEQ